jgi:hypothetical protein
MTVTAPEGPSLVRAGAAVGVAMALSNVLQYVLQLAASRRLTTSEFGGFGALLGLGVVGATLMLSLQTVAARHVAVLRADRSRRRAEVTGLLRTARTTGLGITAVAALASPVVAVFLHVPVAAALWLAASLGPLAYAGAAQGVLQGRERFAALARLFLAVSALRVIGGVGGLLLGSDATWGLAGTAVGALAAGLLAHLAVAGEAGGGTFGRGLTRELGAAANGVLALLTLTGVDLLLARHVLSSAASGRYAAGALVARACFWLPQFVAVLVVPRLASGDTTLVRRAAALVGALGVLEVLGAVFLPGTLVRAALGDQYGWLTHRLALFAAVGACLALLQLLLYAEIAQGRHEVGRLLWGCVAAEAALVLVTRPSLTGVVLTALACTATTLIVAYPRAVAARAHT